MGYYLTIYSTSLSKEYRKIGPKMIEYHTLVNIMLKFYSIHFHHYMSVSLDLTAQSSFLIKAKFLRNDMHTFCCQLFPFNIID